MKRTFTLLLVVAMSLSMLLTGCGGGADDAAANNTQQGEVAEQNAPLEIEAQEGIENPAQNRDNAKDTLVVGFTEAKGDILPAYYSTTYDKYIVQLAFDALISNDEAGNVTPAVAESFEYKNDNRTIEFKLKQGVKFNDGEELTAEDVAFTWTLLSDPSYDGNNFSYAMDLEGYEAYHNGEADSVSGIEVIDPYTIDFTFEEAKASDITQFVLPIMPAHHYAYEKGNTQTVRDQMSSYDIVGSGRYTLTKFEPKQYAQFVANDNWYGGKVNIKNLITKFTKVDTMLQELQTGNVDIQMSVPSKEENQIQLEQMGFVNVNAYPGNSYGYLGYNLRDDRLKDQKVRQALAYGFNREAFIQIYYNGNASVCNSPISQVSWAYTEDVPNYPYDTEKAIALLEEAGWTDTDGDGIRDKDGMKLSFVWDTYTDSKYVETLIPMLQADWKKIGVSVEANLMDFNSLVEKVYTERDFDMYNMAWSMTTDPGDSYSTFHSEYDVPDGNNSIGLRNEEVDKLLDEGVKEFDKEKRKAIYQEWAILMGELQPYMFISQTDEWDVYNSRVKNFKSTSYENWTYYIQNVEIAE